MAARLSHVKLGHYQYVVLAHAHVNLFTDAFHSTPVETLTLSDALKAIRSETYCAAVRRLRAILASNGKPAYNRDKPYLPAYTFTGTFVPSRATAHLQQHSGIVHGDLDGLDEVGLDETRAMLIHDPRTV